MLSFANANAQTLSDAVLTTIKTNNPQLKCMMPTFKVWMQRPKEQKLDGTTN
jgi:hypothetical protein